MTLINSFEVPTGEEEAALQFWEQAAEYMRRQPGFISTRLHKALSPDARFTYVNIAEWESAEHFEAVISREEFKRLTEGSQGKVLPLNSALTRYLEVRVARCITQEAKG